MSTLTAAQIELITNEIKQGNIQSKEMQEDLIDHFCCVVEDEIDKGKSFKDAYQAAFLRIFPNGLDEIRKETVLLMPAKNRKRLDKLMYSSGLVSITGALVTVAMKLWHLPYAQIILMATAFVSLFFFLPSLFTKMYKQEIGVNKIRYILGFIGVFSLMASAVFKMSHWPGASMLLVLAVLCIYLVLFPLFFFKIYIKDKPKE